jgi:hypothetical protein
MTSSERIEPLDERGYPVLALCVTALLLIAILGQALTAGYP